MIILTVMNMLITLLVYTLMILMILMILTRMVTTILLMTILNQAPTIKFSARNSSTVWDFTVKSSRLLKGVTLLGVEHLQHFAIADVALVSKEGDFKYESKGQECLLEEDKEEAEGNSAAESTSPPSPTIYKYSFKLKFHTKIFGTFKQTLVLDFGVRPLLSKVLK